MKENKKNKNPKQFKIFSNKNTQKIKINIKKKNIEPYLIREMQNTFGSFKFNNNNATYDKKITNSFSFISSISTTQDEQKLNKTIKTIQNKDFKLKYNININNSNLKEINRPFGKKHTNLLAKNKYTKIEIDEEVDKFKSSIDNLMKIIENFENEYINSNKQQLIKEQLNQITHNHTYFSKNDFNKSSLINQKLNDKKILDNGKNNKSKQTVNMNKNNILKQKYNSTISNISNEKNKNFLSETFSSNKNEINAKLKLTGIFHHKEIKKKIYNSHLSNLVSGNAYDRRVNYSHLLSQKVNNRKNKINKNMINNTKTTFKNEVTNRFKRPKENEDNMNNTIINKSTNYDFYRKKYKHCSSKTNIDKKWNEIKLDCITDTENNTREIYFNNPNKATIDQNIDFILNRKNKRKKGISNSVHLSSDFNKTSNLSKAKEKKTY